MGEKEFYKAKLLIANWKKMIGKHSQNNDDNTVIMTLGTTQMVTHSYYCLILMNWFY